MGLAGVKGIHLRIVFYWAYFILQSRSITLKTRYRLRRMLSFSMLCRCGLETLTGIIITCFYFHNTTILNLIIGSKTRWSDDAHIIKQYVWLARASWSDCSLWICTAGSINKTRANRLNYHCAKSERELKHWRRRRQGPLQAKNGFKFYSRFP